MILTHWSCSRCKDILQTLKVYKILVKEDQVDDRWDADKNQFGKYWFGNIENMSPVLHNYKNKTGQELSEFKILLLSDSSTILFKKTKKCPRNATFLYKFFYKVQNMSP